MPIRDRVCLHVFEDGVVVVGGNVCAGRDLAVQGTDGELGEGRMGQDLAEVSEGLDGDGAVGGIGVVLDPRFDQGSGPGWGEGFPAGLTFGLMTGASAIELDRSVRVPRDKATRLEAVSEMYDALPWGM